MDPKAKAVLNYCKQVLRNNSVDGYTVPSRDIYPHQWLWDSCFTAIGLRHIDIERAKKELTSLKRGTWKNGMLPNIIFHKDFFNVDHMLWNSNLRPEAPKEINTSCITQPPVLAEAVVRVGESMPRLKRIKWYKSMYSCLLNYHQWLYSERNPDEDGLIVLLHPYESGLDNSPPWMQALGKMKYPWWIKAAHGHTVRIILNHLRRDTEFVPTSQRIGLKDALQCFYAIRRLTKNGYKFIPGSKKQIAIQDLAFNSMLIRANKHLVEIAKVIDKKLPPEMIDSMNRTEQSLEKLWSREHGQYFSRNYLSKRLIKQNTIATFMPLYAGCIAKTRAEQLVGLLKDPQSYGTDFPVPSVALSSKKFRKNKYWQGPAWINTNWLIIQGLENYGFKGLAKEISDRSIHMIEEHGPYEYFSAIDGSPKGVKDFSWTAALAIDLIKTKL